jgi:hypothetical protein
MATPTQRGNVAAADRLTVEVGDVSSPDGLTRVVLGATGELYAEHLAAADERKTTAAGEPETTAAYRGRVSEEQSLDLFRRAREFAWGLTFPSRPGIPDEAIVVWRLEHADGETLVLKAWLRDVEKDPAAGPVLMALRRQLAELSHNRLYL